ncbi:potassium-transporting ATPase subunit KdpA [Stieleria varia]|uniref:Potassium-transporting ATPase potassium-binding subunit n=1 Tax=Stieleria varia TaxID=2528005 RepID=A0A5C6B726_9BACT|nr:potassium-transporting ATPase subunit KdpA [Stieleria varia]TWU06284.1 Potassium-transporting ATPase A chain [Stieleria varia]
MLGLSIPLIIIGATIALSWPLSRYMRWAMDSMGSSSPPNRFDSLAVGVLGNAASKGQTWKEYCVSMLVFNVFMFVVVFTILTTQQWLPLNPDGKEGLEASLAFNTAASFTSNTNLQHYSGEVSMSYLSQLGALMWLQFVSAATGLAAVTALCRGLSGRTNLGNFYQDVWRATGLILLPLAFVLASLLVLFGTPMTLEGAAVATTLEGATQTIARGPVAAFVTIKQLGTNGGGFFGPNSTHPLENPSFFTNVLTNMAIILIPMATVWMFGWITNRIKHAAVVFAVMLVIYTVFVGSAAMLESQPTQAFARLPVEADMNLEGKELRFGTTAGALWAVSTTSTSNGSVNAMHDSLNPLTGLFPMAGMWLNVIFGGVGVGLINMFLYVITAVFLAGMMVGRTPEYLGRKVEAREMKLAILALLAHPFFILGGAAIFASSSWGLAALNNPGSHGLSEIIYEFSSAAANNGSGFEGLGDNTVPWNVATGVVMLLGRFIPIIAPLAIVGSMAAKRATPESSGTFRVDTPTFGVVLMGTVLIVGALLFLPIAVLGPIAEFLTAV